MKTIFVFKAADNTSSAEKTEEHIRMIRSMLEHSSDIYIFTADQKKDVYYHVAVPADSDGYFRRITADLRRYLSYFDYIAVETFRMLTDTACLRGSSGTDEPEDDLQEGFYDAAFKYGMDPDSREKYEKMLRLAEDRRYLGGYDAQELLDRISDLEESFPGCAQCLRDRDIQIHLLRNGQTDLFWDYLQTRSELFEYRIMPDERRESDIILDRVIRFSRLMRIDRGYYCEAVYRLITDGELQKARIMTVEGLISDFDDSEDDRRAVWKLHYYRMLLSEDPQEAAEEADLLSGYPDDIKDLIWNYDMNSCAVLSGEVYYRTSQYLKAEEAISTQYGMIISCMEPGKETVDLPMDLDEQFRILLLKAELLRRTEHDPDMLFDAYRKCFEMISYIHSCIEERGFVMLTGISEADSEYVLNNMRRYHPENTAAAGEPVNGGSDERHYTAIYSEDQE